MIGDLPAGVSGRDIDRHFGDYESERERERQEADARAEAEYDRLKDEGYYD